MSQFQPYEPETQSSAPTSAKTGGYILYGCLGVLFAGILLLGCGGFVGYFAVSNQVKKFTSTTPQELPAVQYDPEQLAELESRIERFQAVFEAEPAASDQLIPAPAEVAAEVQPPLESSTEPAPDRGVPASEVGESNPSDAQPDRDKQPSPAADAEQLPRELVLTADDINALIGKEEQLRNRVFVKIRDGKVTGDISVPIESLIPGSKGRYLNASGTFEVTFEHGVLIITLQDAEVKGEKLPEHIMQPLRQQNLAEDLYKDPKNARMIGRFESIEVEDDQIVARLRDEQS